MTGDGHEGLLLIANPAAAAGRGLQRWEALQRAVRARGLAADVVVTAYAGHAIALAQAAAGRYRAAVAVGGDGTVNEVAEGLIRAGRHDTALGIVPFGTGNDVAMLHGILNTEDALRALAEGTTRALDVVRVTCRRDGSAVTRHALIYGAVGFTAEVLRQTTRRVKRLFGPRYCYSVGFFRALVGYASPAMEVRTAEGAFSGRMFTVICANAEAAGGGTMRLGPGARMDDGLMNVSVVEAMARGRIIRCFPQLLNGTFPGLPEVTYFPSTRASVDATPPSAVAVDGDIVGETPAEFEVVAGALRVLCVR